MGLGNGGPDTRSGLAVALAEQPARLSGQFLSAAVMLWSAHRHSTCLVVLAPAVIPRTPPGELPSSGTPATATGQKPHRRTGHEPDAGTDVSVA